jgi:outer membrane receptor protein involved in Fe transport
LDILPSPTTSHSRALKSAGLVLLLLGSMLAPASAAEDMYFGDVPLVLTASRLPQTAFEAPAPITVIDRETIEASGFTELQDLLRLVPGFLVADWGGGSPTVANHGLGDGYGRRIKVLIDGRTVNNPLRGNVDWQDLPVRVDDIERVEVVRGPDGAVYGANAFQAVVQFITRSPTTEEGKTLIARAGNNSFQDLGLRFNGTTSGGLDWRATVSQRRANPFHDFSSDGPIKSTERNVANLQGVMQINNEDQLRFFAGLTTGYDRTGFPENPAYPTHHAPLEEAQLQLAWQHSFSPDSELLLQYAHLQHSEQNDYTVTTPRFNLPVDQDVDMWRDEVDFQINHRFSSQWQALAGASVRHDTVHSSYFFDSSDNQGGTQYQVFGNVTWNPVPELAINLGGTWEDHYYGGQLFSPRVAVNYAFTPFSVVRMSTGTAYRAPTIQESTSFQLTRRNGRVIDIGVWSRQPLDSERVHFVELGYVGSLPELGLSLDARVFHETYDRYIDDQRCRYDTTDPARRCVWPQPTWLRQERALGRADTNFFVNAGSVRMDGADFRLDWRKPGWGRLIVNQSFVDVDELRSNTDPDMVLSAPHSMSSLLFIKELPERWNASLGFYYTDKMYWLNDGDVVPSHARTDVRLARRFGPAERENEIAITVQSLEGDYTDFHQGKYKHQSFAFATLKLGW